MTSDNPSYYATLRIRLLRDDGAVVYLNGGEVFRSNMPTGTINYLTQASGGADETTFYAAIIPATGLITGTNVLAVEIH